MNSINFFNAFALLFRALSRPAPMLKDAVYIGLNAANGYIRAQISSGHFLRFYVFLSFSSIPLRTEESTIRDLFLATAACVSACFKFFISSFIDPAIYRSLFLFLGTAQWRIAVYINILLLSWNFIDAR